MSNSVPEGWNIYSLDELGQVVGGGTPESNNTDYWGGDIYWATPKEITKLSSRYINKTERTITQDGLDRSSAKLHPIGTILLTSRASVGYPAINTIPMATNQGFQSLRPNNKLDTEYGYQCLLNSRNKLEKLSAGSTFLEISSKEVKKFKVVIPPLPEQKKIAAILTSVDTVIEKTQAQIDKLKDLKTGMMQELLTKGIGHTEFKDSPVGRIPVEWEVKTIGDLANVKRGASPRPIKDKKWWGGNVGWIRISDVTASSKYLNKTTQYLSSEGVSKSIQIPKGEVILSICATIGRPIIINVDACIHDGFVWFDKLNGSIDREYWYYFLASKESFLSAQRQSGTQGNLNTTIVSELICPLPPTSEQKKIASILSSIDKNVEEMQHKLLQTKSIKKALMQDLLTGKVRVKV